MGTKETYTPGPWFIGKADRYGARIFVTHNGAEGLVCARIENHANAKLIATAPELLEALQRLLAHVLEANKDYDATSHARAAIAKATC